MVSLHIGYTHSSDSGVIFFSSCSSSANCFWYFSQLAPRAEGIVRVCGYRVAMGVFEVQVGVFWGWFDDMSSTENTYMLSVHVVLAVVVLMVMVLRRTAAGNRE